MFFKIPSLKTEAEREAGINLLKSFDENEGIQSQGFFYFSGVMFILLIVLFSTQSLLPVIKHLGLGYVAPGMAVIVLIKFKHDVDRSYRALDWDLLFFFAFLFIVIGIMDKAGVLAAIGALIGKLIALGDLKGSLSLLWGSAIMSSVTDNIPLSAVLANILGGLDPKLGPDSGFWWSVIFGCNLGGNITPIGSASTVVAVTIIHKYEIKLSFMGFVKMAVPFAILQLIIATIYIYGLSLL